MTKLSFKTVSVAGPGPVGETPDRSRNPMVSLCTYPVNRVVTRRYQVSGMGSRDVREENRNRQKVPGGWEWSDRFVETIRQVTESESDF